MFLSDDRYSGLRLIPWWDQARLSASQVLVVGAGALGNEVLKNLALVGIGRIYVIDCDSIELSNLARSVLFRARDSGRPKAVVAAEALQELNPDVRVRAFHGNVLSDLGLGLFRSVDVVIGCLDNREARLWVNRQCWKVNTPWIDAGIQEINGVVKVFVPPDSACYECGMTENDYRLINLRYSCPLLSREEMLSGKVPTAPTIASMMAGLQVQEALKLLHGLPVPSGQAHVYNGLANQLYTTAFQRRDDCLSHEHYAHIVPVPLAAKRDTGEQLLRSVQELARGSELGDAEQVEIQLDRDLVVSLDCDCGLVRNVMKPSSQVTLRDATCPACGDTARPQMTHQVRLGDAILSEPLIRLGIPPFDIVRVRLGGNDWYVQLADDQAEVLLDRA